MSRLRALLPPETVSIATISVVAISFAVVHQERMVMNGVASSGDQSLVVSSRDQLGQVLFNIFIDALDVGIQSAINKFIDDTKLRWNVGLLDGRKALQRDLDHVAKKANGILACPSKSVAAGPGQDHPPAPSTGEDTPRALCPLLKFRKDIERLERVQRRAMELRKGLEHKSYEEWLRKLGMFSLEKRRHRGDLIALYSSEKRVKSGEGWFLLSGNQKHDKRTQS
ncbi:hypothetical protein TURU_038638 [Turdus rufiventris]|nr:hypothetical protein TURU_038638 [Turdus rufiventris]